MKKLILKQKQRCLELKHGNYESLNYIQPFIIQNYIKAKKDRRRFLHIVYSDFDVYFPSCIHRINILQILIKQTIA